jgi:hypothetical protein
MKKTLQVLLFVCTFAALSSTARADGIDPLQAELNPNDTFIGPFVEQIDEIFDAFPDIQPTFTVTEDRFDVTFSCSQFPNPCITSLQKGQGEGFSILASLTDLFPPNGPFLGRPDNIPNNFTHITEFTFRALEPPETENVPEPSTLLLMGTGLVALSGIIRRKLLC